MVPGAGIEPARLAAGDFESPASTNFTTRARYGNLGIQAWKERLLLYADYLGFWQALQQFFLNLAWG